MVHALVGCPRHIPMHNPTRADIQDHQDVQRAKPRRDSYKEIGGKHRPGMVAHEGRLAFNCGRGEPAIGRRQGWCATQYLLMPLKRWHPERAIGGPPS